jgi:ATP-dependent DNA helicase RecQ
MPIIAFVDTEIEPNSGKITDIGGVATDGRSFHANSAAGFVHFLRGSQYVCGHNILQHDLRYIQPHLDAAGLPRPNVIDTLYLSPLLFPTKPYHALLKDDKLQTDELNNPLNDAIKAKDLFFDEVAAFERTDHRLKRIYCSLLKGQREFAGFFLWLGFCESAANPALDIRRLFAARVCEHADLPRLVADNPVELAYCLALIHTRSRYSITPPWVLRNFPLVERVMFLLTNNPCVPGCAYCNEALDIHKGLKRFFGFDAYRTYAGEPLQEKAVSAAVANKSLLAVFPTGGGKSITFQVPALMSGVNARGLTVVISPLQSLMKDQVDNLERMGITDAVAINGLLDPIERAKAMARVEGGSASILYISPESLRSRTIERLLLGRNVVRFVIDEAHCFSAWGQDFRVDYLYIGDFIRLLQEKKNLADGIPVSCFTATAKQKVIEDIRAYFREKLGLEMEVFRSSASRSNLRYLVFEKGNEEEKYQTVRELIDAKPCPTIVYVSRTKKANELAQRLALDGYVAKAYHGKMDKREKSANQDAFTQGEVQIMVATSAFGMGVDKKDVGMVIHYDISDSLENYVQEAGRAGRDESITADCYVLFNDEDLNKHFILLNQTKVSIQEIQQVWKAIKDLTRVRSKVSQSALEIARRAGWDDAVGDIETRVKTAIAALEEAGYVQRGQNMPRVFADGLRVRNAEEAIRHIQASERFDEQQKVQAIRIMRSLIASRSRKRASDEEAESRVDYISDRLGLEREDVIRAIQLLREINLLADSKDLTAYIKRTETRNRSLVILKSFAQLERFLLGEVEDEEHVVHLKELNERAEADGIVEASPAKLRTILNLWAIKGWIKRQNEGRDHVAVLRLFDRSALADTLARRHELAQFIVEFLGDPIRLGEEQVSVNGEMPVEFSVLELKEEYARRSTLFQSAAMTEEVEDALYYLAKIEALKLEGGFMVVYNPLTIERMETDNKKRYKVEDYQKLNQFYENKMQQIHIVGEYARKMIDDYKAALQFVDDYFQLNYVSFLGKYFKGSRQEEIRRNITPAKFRQLFGELSPTQLGIINDKSSPCIVVAAGPGSGKTRILVHKLASLLLMEDVKHEQLLMLTFARSAATEFKRRLLALIGNAANFVEIRTFHSYCFDLLGRLGTLDKSEQIIREAVERIRGGDVEAGRVTKTVLVVDEAQDMDAQEFALVEALMERNEEMRVIAVGDDDQNIFEFRGSSSEYMKRLTERPGAALVELVENYRSKANLVDYANQFVRTLPHRLKHTPIIAMQRDNGAIRRVRYRSDNLIVPLVDEVREEGLAGSTCVLTKSNEEAAQITALLLRHGVPAKLIQSNEGFSLLNLLEVRFFLGQIEEASYIIDDELWAGAKRRLVERFGVGAEDTPNPNLEMCLNLLRAFEAVHLRHKYRTDLELFIRESKLEDFFGDDIETIVVATIHKAKGREFDNVFLMLDRFNSGTAEARRQLYVAITRAKRSLTICDNGGFLNFIRVEGMDSIEDAYRYEPPDQFVAQLTYRDIWLDFFEPRQHLIAALNSGNRLLVDAEGCRSPVGQPVLRFSKAFAGQVEALRQRGFLPVTSTIRFIVFWRKENSEQEIRIILPEIWFERT